jgi:hypothetical protein
LRWLRQYRGFSGSIEHFLGIYSGRINEQSDLGFVWIAEAVRDTLWQTVSTYATPVLVEPSSVSAKGGKTLALPGAKHAQLGDQWPMLLASGLSAIGGAF